MTAAWGRVPDLLAAHLLLSFAALALGLAVALPLIVLASRNAAVARIALGFASLVQTIPALALLALFFPILFWLGLPPLGFLPALLALSLYALLPILRNGVTGLAGLDPAVIEAADGIGMTPAQKLRLVEAPLVLPVLMAGIRTAAVWTIGAATLATTVGQPSLGDLIFAGLQTQAWPLVLAGCIASAGLAIAVDALLGLAERGIATGRRWLWGASLAVLAIAAGIAIAPRFAAKPDSVVVGAKNFAEQFILARLIGQRLEAAGYAVTYREGLGSAVAYGALKTGAIDVYVDYAGTIWTGEMKRSDTPPAARMLPAIDAWARATSGVRLVGPLGFENAYAFAMKGADAKRRGIATLADLAAQSGQLRLGADLEFLDRPEWAAVQRAYPMRFATARAYSPSFMYASLGSGTSDVISAFSSDGRIAADGLVTLTDPKGAIPRYDAILLVAPRRAGDARFAAALRPLLNAIPVGVMRKANYLVDRDTDKRTPDEAARWLAKAISR
ncbi:ABC transporter permease/substrate-binding protein [Sphingomonas donggukensis]|uniref:ABC transporter permease/substrate-binding protein n=1 Tax=Sphingomonas donggukensis TaxID=2949093 RepID=A0ABY4TWT0_9SPHN|nr:ABC transporter permease/substrate-binding protein [Sphingomonas donggukensis]URW74991.1 ABC transporter permease/substrate-binding protein [Sphingomonas donggukensis]